MLLNDHNVACSIGLLVCKRFHFLRRQNQPGHGKSWEVDFFLDSLLFMAVLTACKAAKEISNDVKDVAKIKNHPQDRGNYHLC